MGSGHLGGSLLCWASYLPRASMEALFLENLRVGDGSQKGCVARFSVLVNVPLGEGMQMDEVLSANVLVTPVIVEWHKQGTTVDDQAHTTHCL